MPITHRAAFDDDLSTALIHDLSPRNPQDPVQTGAPPTPSDDAPGGSGGSDSTTSHTGGLVNYYFVFLALVICLAGLGVFIGYRRRRLRRTGARDQQQHVLAQDLSTWDPARARRRYWQGRWRSVEDEDMMRGREEGFDEHGEAPPPYLPKEVGGEGRTSEGGTAGGDTLSQPALPLQALSREQAGLKPPDYAETVVRSVDERPPPRGSR